MKLYIQMIASYGPSWGFGGPLRIFYDYAKLLETSFDVHILAGDVHHDYRRLSKDSKLPDIHVNRYRVIFRRLSKLNINFVAPSIFFGAYKRIKSSDDEVVLHICETRGSIYIYAAVLKFLFGDKVKLIHSGFGMLQVQSSFIRKIYDTIFLGWTFSMVDIFLAQNDHEMLEYHKFFGEYLRKDLAKEKVFLVPLHVPQKNIASYSSKSLEVQNLARAKFNLPVDDICLVFLGRLNSNKGIIRTHNAAKAYSRASQRKVHMIFAGRDEGFGATLRELKASTASADYEITIIENIYGDLRFDLYKAADIFLGCPLVFEETMLASLEALAVGTPSIVSLEASIPYAASCCGAHEVADPVSEIPNLIDEILKNYNKSSEDSLSLIKNNFSDQKVRLALLDICNG